MSVDVSIGDEWLNFTHNTSRLWHDHLSCGEQTGFLAIHGKTGAQAFALLRTAFDRMDRTRVDLWRENDVGEPRFCAKYDSPNGWGSAVGGVMFMARVMAACAANGRKRVRVSV